jgi:hypothetical protein
LGGIEGDLADGVVDAVMPAAEAELVGELAEEPQLVAGVESPESGNERLLHKGRRRGYSVRSHIDLHRIVAVRAGWKLALPSGLIFLYR